MRNKLFALAALLSSSSGLLAGCGTLATVSAVPAPLDGPAGEMVPVDNPGALAAKGYTTQATRELTFERVGKVVLNEKFETGIGSSNAIQFNQRWNGYHVPSIPGGEKYLNFYTMVQPGLQHRNDPDISRQAVAAWSGNARRLGRTYLELRNIVQDGPVISRFELTFGWGPYAQVGPNVIRTAPLMVEASLNGGSWTKVWDSRMYRGEFVDAKSLVATGWRDAVPLAKGNWRIRFVTECGTLGQPTPKLDSIQIAEMVRATASISFKKPSL